MNHDLYKPLKPRLLDQVRETIRTKYYSIRTEQSYVQWIRRYILFHNKRHPKVKNQHKEDLAQGYGSVYLPNAFERKYRGADKSWIWQYVFPSSKISVDPPFWH
ncbi:MAG: hypothetical protein BMS9Abin03_110 [Thermodesulfobacteriota bacterium]|nr:MAG: hypothetical protein BMS9Abin03_110 [Thermodesulfobacteriota bacterium]